MSHNLFNTRSSFKLASGKQGTLYSLPALEAAGIGKISRLPVSIRIVLESVLRNFDGLKITEQHVRELANWQPNAPRTEEIPFVVARILLQDFTGVPLLADLAAMRDAAAAQGRAVEQGRRQPELEAVEAEGAQLAHERLPVGGRPAVRQVLAEIDVAGAVGKVRLARDGGHVTDSCWFPLSTSHRCRGKASRALRAIRKLCRVTAHSMGGNGLASGCPPARSAFGVRCQEHRFWMPLEGAEIPAPKAALRVPHSKAASPQAFGIHAAGVLECRRLDAAFRSAGAGAATST